MREQDDEWGPKPQPQTEPGTPHPGGVDAHTFADEGPTQTPDLPLSPTTTLGPNAEVVDALQGPEDTDTQATQAAGTDTPGTPHEEPPA